LPFLRLKAMRAATSRRTLLASPNFRDALLILIGIGIILLGVKVYSYSHEVAVLLFFAGVVVAYAGVIDASNRLPWDASPWHD
jgi:uncharacterized membrane protein SirB2